MPQRYLLLGAHLEAGDLDGIDGVVSFDGGAVRLSAIPYDSDRGIAARETIERAAALRQALTSRQTFVAIRYGATAGNEPEAREKCAQYAERWRALLIEYRGHVEVTMRLGAPSGALRPKREDFENGRDYLIALRNIRSAMPDPEFVNAVEVAFAPIAVRKKWNRRDDGTLEFVALVRRDDLPRVKNVGESLQASFGNVPFLLSGPWPLEVFAHDE